MQGFSNVTEPERRWAENGQRRLTSRSYLLDKQRVSFFLGGLWHSGEQSPVLAPQGGDLRGEEKESRHENHNTSTLLVFYGTGPVHFLMITSNFRDP